MPIYYIDFYEEYPATSISEKDESGYDTEIELTELEYLRVVQVIEDYQAIRWMLIVMEEENRPPSHVRKRVLGPIINKED